LLQAAQPESKRGINPNANQSPKRRNQKVVVARKTRPLLQIDNKQNQQTKRTQKVQKRLNLLSASPLLLGCT
jgi:Asp/Glu/hydantoin racemase